MSNLPKHEVEEIFVENMEGGTLISVSNLDYTKHLAYRLGHNKLSTQKRRIRNANINDILKVKDPSTIKIAETNRPNTGQLFSCSKCH